MVEAIVGKDLKKQSNHPENPNGRVDGMFGLAGWFFVF
jgi:hypothetical protein